MLHNCSSPLCRESLLYFYDMKCNEVKQVISYLYVFLFLARWIQKALGYSIIQNELAIPAKGLTQVCLWLFPGVLWLWHFLYSVGALLFVSQWQCISYFVLYIAYFIKRNKRICLLHCKSSNPVWYIHVSLFNGMAYCCIYCKFVGSNYTEL